MTAKNLATMSFATFPHALEALREVLHQAGMLEQERQVSIAIQQTIQAKIKKTPWRKMMFEKTPKSIDRNKGNRHAPLYHASPFSHQSISRSLSH